MLKKILKKQRGRKSLKENEVSFGKSYISFGVVRKNKNVEIHYGEGEIAFEFTDETANSFKIDKRGILQIGERMKNEIKDFLGAGFLESKKKKGNLLIFNLK